MKKIIKFFVDDIKTDFMALKEMFSDDEVATARRKQRLAVIKKELTTGWGEWAKTGWVFLLIIALAFAVGWYHSAKHYQQKCNEFIYENYIVPEQGNIIIEPLESYNYSNINISNFSVHPRIPMPEDIEEDDDSDEAEDDKEDQPYFSGYTTIDL